MKPITYQSAIQGLMEKFDKEFGDYFPKVTVTARQAGDFEKAQKIEKVYRELPDNIKEFLLSEIPALIKAYEKSTKPKKAHCTCGESDCEALKGVKSFAFERSRLVKAYWEET